MLKKLNITKDIKLELSPFNLTLIGTILQGIWIVVSAWFNVFDFAQDEKVAYYFVIISLLPASCIYAYGKLLELNLKISITRKIVCYLILVGLVTFASYWIFFVFSWLVFGLNGR